MLVFLFYSRFCILDLKQEEGVGKPWFPVAEAANLPAGRRALKPQGVKERKRLVLPSESRDGSEGNPVRSTPILPTSLMW